jgi:protein MAK11
MKSNLKRKRNDDAVLASNSSEENETKSDTSNIKDSHSDSASYLRISACSYEGTLFGWKFMFDESLTSLENVLDFGFNIIKAPLKTLAVSPNKKYLAVGGVDERVRIFNVKQNKSVCELINHSGDITCLAFAGNEYLLSSSLDESVNIWNVKDWSCAHALKHTAAVVDLSIHPSSKVCLTLSTDRSLKIWDLMRGTCAHTERLKQDFDRLSWSSDGNYYFLQADRLFHLYESSSNRIVFEMKSESRINQASFVKCGAEDENGHIVIIYENFMLKLFDIEGKEVSSLDFSNEAHGRIRQLYVQTPNKIGVEDIDSMIETDGESIVIATSLGRILLLNAKAIKDGMKLDACTQSICELKSEPRFTAVVAW